MRLQGTTCFGNLEITYDALWVCFFQATFSGYTDTPSPKIRSAFEDSTSEVSIPGAEEAATASQNGSSVAIEFTTPNYQEEPEVVNDSEEITPESHQFEHAVIHVSEGKCLRWSLWPKGN